MADLDEIVLTVDEFEALRLKDFEGLDQDSAASRMDISQPTMHRLLNSARNKVADAIVNGKGLKIEGGVYELTLSQRKFKCADCGNKWEVPYGTGRPDECPGCCSARLHRAD